MVREYFCTGDTPDEEMYLPLICGAMRSVAKLCIIPMQDIFGYGNEARMNTPSTTGGKLAVAASAGRILRGNAEKIQRTYQTVRKIAGKEMRIFS